jgi:glucoamylase
MPRDLPLSNGSLLVNFDSTYTLRDIYYPYVGLENQTDGHESRLGVWADGQFAWVDGDGWSRQLLYVHDTLATAVTLRHDGLGLQIECADVVDFHEDAMVRHFVIRDLQNRDRDVRLFFHHDFHLYGTEIGDTAYFDPTTGALIHYKNMRYMLMLGGTILAGKLHVGLDGYATGTKEVGSQEGTWRDAEDGVLGRNPIAQGSVDSTAQINVSVPAGGAGDIYFWLGVGENHEQVSELNERIIRKGPAQLIKRTSDYWQLWCNKENYDYLHTAPDIVDAFQRSLLVLRTQIDDHGAIIAANDADIIRFARDTYSYMWPRDGALVCYALSMAGYDHVPELFFEFCHRVISRHGYFLHKYNPDGSLASSWHPWVDGSGLEKQLPIQEDETALVLWSLWEYFRRRHAVEMLKPLYRPLVIAAADFMCQYRDKSTGLPLPSYDLWEERRGVLSFTVGAVYGGLTAAAKLAEAFGDDSRARRYAKGAQEIKQAAEQYLYDEEIGRFARMVTVHPDGTREYDRTVDASMYGLWYYGMIPVDDPRITRTMDAIKSTLWCNTPIGGLARYENDSYQRVQTPDGAPAVPGNSWFICTMWYAQYLIAIATTHEELDAIDPLLEWAVQRALPSGVMAEQINPYTGAPVSVSPLTWSHAAFVSVVLEYLDRHTEIDLCEHCGRPMYFRELPSMRESHKHQNWVQPANPPPPPEATDKPARRAKI